MFFCEYSFYFQEVHVTQYCPRPPRYDGQGILCTYIIITYVIMQKGAPEGCIYIYAMLARA